MERIYHLIVHKPKSVFLALVLFTGFLGAHAVHFRIDSSTEHLLATNDPNKLYYDKVRAIFGNDEMGVIGVVAENVYTSATLEKIRRITSKVEKIDGVQSVRSLTNLPDLIADLNYPPLLIPTILPDPQKLAALRKKIEDYPIYAHFVSKNAKGAAILVYFKSLSEDEFLQKRVDERIQDILAHEQGPEQLYLTGMQHIKLNLLTLMRQDLRTFTPLSLLVIMVVLGVCFQNLRGVLLPLLSVVFGVVWTLGIMVLADSPITIGTLVLPSLLIVIGSTYSIYVIAQYEEEAEKGGSAAEVVLRSLKRVSLPVTVAALTTVVGFAALLINRIGAIRALGLYAAVGFVSVTIIVLTLIPAALALLPLPRSRNTASKGKQLTTLLTAVGQFNRQYQAPIIVTAALLIIPCLWGMSRIRADSNFLLFFKPTSPVRLANEIISEKIVGAQPFSIIVSSPEKGGIGTWDILKRIKNLQLYLATIPGIDTTVSLADLSELVDRAIRQGGSADDIIVDEEEGATLPASAATASPDAPFWEQEERFNSTMRLLKNVNPTSIATFANLDFSMASIVVFSRLTSSSDIVHAAENIRRYAEDHFPPEIEVRPTGGLILLNEATEDIVWGQVKSLGLALVVIFVVLSFMFLSVKVGFLSLLPNALAILIFFGAMGWTGVTLNLGTSIIASIAIGIAVEDAIRYLARLSAEIRATHDQELALFQTVATVGKPIIYASAALGLGFLTFLFSNFVPIQKFGLLTAITIAAAFVNDLVLLPALLATTRIITLWDVLALTLGKDPHRTIPLFAGLRSAQAKVVTLMGKLKTFPRGQPIIQKGEVGDEMYVLIKGTADVFTHNHAGQRRLVRTLQRGDVFGEMGLLRSHERTADVIANEEVEVIAVDKRFLDHMQRRYPRIGARIFLNIAKILGDRLQEAQQPKTDMRIEEVMASDV